MTNPWQVHLTAYRASHPSLTLRESMVGASKTYRGRTPGATTYRASTHRGRTPGATTYRASTHHASIIGEFGVTASNWFIAWEEGWVAADPKLRQAIDAFFKQDISNTVQISDTAYTFAFIGDMNDRRYAVQEHNNGPFREMIQLSSGKIYSSEEIEQM